MPATAKALAPQFAVAPGKAADFEAFFDELAADLQPEGALENELFLQMAHAAWTMRRCRLTEAALMAGPVDPLMSDDHLARLRMIDSFLRHAQASFNQALKELRVIQTERQLRVEIQPADKFPNAEETMRSAAPLIDSGRIYRDMAAHARREKKEGLRLLEQSLMAPLFDDRSFSSKDRSWAKDLPGNSRRKPAGRPAPDLSSVGIGIDA